MAKHLGNFGKKREAHDATFGWLGRTFRVHPDLTDLSLIQFMEQATEVDEQDESSAYALVVGQLKALVHPDEWDDFLALSVEHRQQYRDLMVLMKGLIEALGERPTGRRSDSDPGRRKTKGKSKVGSSGRVIRALEQRGRPDLAVAVVQARAGQRTA